MIAAPEMTVTTDAETTLTTDVEMIAATTDAMIAVEMMTVVETIAIETSAGHTITNASAEHPTMAKTNFRNLTTPTLCR